MLKPINLRVDFSRLGSKKYNKIVSSKYPVFSWGGYTDVQNDVQSAYRVVVKVDDEIVWDSGVVNSDLQYAKYDGPPLPISYKIMFSVCIAGKDGVMSDWACDYFYCATFDELPDAKWICSPDDEESVPSYFRREFNIDKKIADASLFVSGIGYNSVTVNGEKIDDSYLNTAISDYRKVCFYNVYPQIENFLYNGGNCIGVIVADGWRRNNGEYLSIYNNTPGFFGTPCLWAALRLTYCDGSVEWVCTDEKWQCTKGAITYNHLFNGETYDARKEIANWDIYGCNHNFTSAKLFDGELGGLIPMTLDPIVCNEEVSPKSINYIGDGKYIVDFGVNMPGVVRVKLPDNMEEGHKVVITHSQLLHDDGSLNTDCLRGALCEDTYIASGNDNDLCYWQPELVYHGFRYVQVCGIPLLEKDDIVALNLATQMHDIMEFECGSPVINQAHKMIMQTEKATIHSFINDTCGRSERMGWLGDGSVHFKKTADNLDVGKLFPHMMKNVMLTQDENGAISDTVPHIYGRKPADPVASSYLVMGHQTLMQTGNYRLIEEHYDSYRAWQELLLSNTTDYIMDYTYYGDWAGPEYSRDKNTMGGGAGSATIPPIMMGTYYLILNCRYLMQFAEILGKNDDAQYYDELDKKISKAFMDKWYEYGTGKMYNGSQSCQAIALTLGLIPEKERAEAARIMRDDLVNSNYRFTTGIYCLPLLCNCLAEYGYVNEVYELLSRDEYPSFGYMMQCGATTCWEKWEYLTGNSMNAHIHPMQGSVMDSFYKKIVGVYPVGVGYSEFDVNPHYPEKLLTASMTIESVRGEISVRWRRHNGTTNLCVNVPFNTKANIHTPDGIKTVGSGFYSFTW